MQAVCPTGSTAVTPEFSAAGVLPYAVYAGQILFLLGKERFVSAAQNNSAHMRSRLVWSDFGGRREPADADAEHTAAREFSEETLGLFASLNLNALSVKQSECTMLTRLRSSEGVYKTQNGLYSMFVAKVEYIELLMFTIARNMSDDGTADRSLAHGKPTPALDKSEKLEWMWVPSSALLGALESQEHRKHRNNVVARVGVKQLRMFYKFVISLRGEHFSHEGTRASPTTRDEAAVGMSFREVVDAITKEELDGESAARPAEITDRYGRMIWPGRHVQADCGDEQIRLETCNDDARTEKEQRDDARGASACAGTPVHSERMEKEQREQREHLWRSIGSVPSVQMSRKQKQLGICSSPQPPQPQQLVKKRKKRQRRRRKGRGAAGKEEAEKEAKAEAETDEQWRVIQLMSREAEASSKRHCGGW
jgi:hypothetical protein